MPSSDLSINNNLKFWGGGEMAGLMRAKNWADTVIGTPDTWPQSLKTTLSIILNSKFPMFLFWGPDLICFYNDAYRPSLGTDGKHPGILGQPGEDAWQEIWPSIKPIIDLVLNGEDTSLYQDQLLPIYRNGKLEDVYWTFSYSPVADETGAVAGVFATCVETTDSIQAKVTAQNVNAELATSNEEIITSNEELRQSQESLQITLSNLTATENKLRSFVSGAPFPIGVYVGREMRIELANQAILDVWGKGNDVIGKLYSAVLPELDNQAIFTQLDEVYTTGVAFHARNQRVDLMIDGRNKPYYFNYSFTPLYDGDGRIYGVMNTAADVTDLNVAMLKVEQSEKTLQDIILQSPVAMCIMMGPQHIVTLANQLIIDLWGKPEALVINRPIFEALPDARGQGLEELMEKVYFNGDTFRANEMPVNLIRNGLPDLVYQNFVYQPYRDADGIILGVIATTIDVTEQVLARKELQDLNEELASVNEEQAAANEELSAIQQNLNLKVAELANSESRFRLLVEQAPVAIAVFKTKELVIDLVNKLMLEVWGKTPDITGKPLAVAMPELIGQPFIPLMANVFTTGESYYGYESRALVSRNGEMIEGYFNFICQPIKNEHGIITSILQVVTEVTDQVNARLEVQKAEEMMRLAIDAAKLGTWHIDPATKDLKYNAALARIFGYEGEKPMTYDQAIGQVTNTFRKRITAAIEKAIEEGGDYDITYSQRRFNDGELIWLRSLGKVSSDENGNFILFSGFVMDITELKKDEIRKNDFIGMVSHELKTPLTSLGAIVQVANSKLKNNSDTFLAGAMEKANVQVKKMGAMINGFLNISRLESGKIMIDKKTFDLEELIGEMIDEMKLTISTHIINLDGCGDLEVYADREKISSVITNLLSNAIKYSPKSKLVHVSCKLTGKEAIISVKDEGMGIAAVDANKIFERYYRVETEDNRHISGFGIGLYLSAEIIKQHGGKIWVDSTLGQGSTFHFSLPVA